MEINSQNTQGQAALGNDPGTNSSLSKVKVKIYSTPMCPWCEQAKSFFTSLNIPFEEIDVSTDEKAAQLMVEKSDQTGVPVIEIDDKVIVGFDKPLLEEILGLNKREDTKSNA
jgi:glutaredoxin-like YruB-family protein